MKPVFLSLAVVAVMALPASQALAGGCGGGPIETPDVLATHIVTDINAGDLNFVESYFDRSMSATMPSQSLADAWRIYQDRLGALQSLGQPTLDVQGDLTVAHVPVQFAQGSGEVRVTFNGDMMIDNLSFMPARSPAS